MKLYNEDQVNLAMRLSHSTELTYLEIIKSLEATELPTDEEIFYESDDEDFITQQYAFVRGAKYVINKIKGGNK